MSPIVAGDVGVKEHLVGMARGRVIGGTVSRVEFDVFLDGLENALDLQVVVVAHEQAEDVQGAPRGSVMGSVSGTFLARATLKLVLELLGVVLSQTPFGLKAAFVGRRVLARLVNKLMDDRSKQGST